jgi:hypothetical protein
LFSLFVLFLAAALLAGCTLSHPLVGRWKTQSSDGTESVLWFKSDGTFEAIAKGENLPGKWTFNEDTDPKQLELVFEDRTIVTIAKLNGDELLIEPREEEAEMPSSFSDDAQKYRRQ